MKTASPQLPSLDKQKTTFPARGQQKSSVARKLTYNRHQSGSSLTSLNCIDRETPLGSSLCCHNRRTNAECSGCEDSVRGKHGKVAVSVCRECNINLGSGCAIKHEEFADKEHSVIPMSATKAAPARQAHTKNGFHPSMCREEGHKDVPRYFCEVCEDVLCLECTEHQHKKHRFLYVKDAYAKHRAALELHIDKARDEALRISKLLEHNDAILSELRARKNDISKMIKNHTATLVEAIRKQEEKLLMDLDGMFLKKEEIIGKKRERCQTRLELINRTCKFTEMALNDADELQVLVFKKYAKKRLEELCRPENLTSAADNIDPKYFVPPSAMDQVKKLGGHVVLTAADPNYCVAHGKGLDLAIVGQEASFIITAKDKEGKPLANGGDEIQVQVSSIQEESILSRVFDRRNGTYRVTYSPKLSGVAAISVRIYGQPIKNSEFNAHVVCQRDYGKITRPFLTIGGFFPSSEEISLKLPCGVAVDGKGRILIADCHNHCIKVTTPDGKFIKSFGSFGTKNGQLNNPTDIVIRQEKVYVCDKDNNRVQCFTLDGVFLAKFCYGCCHLKRPWGICVDSRGNILVVDTRNDQVQVFSEDGNFVTSFGSEGSRDAEFRQPYFAAAHPNGRIYITDNGNHRVQVFDETYSYLFRFGCDAGELALKNPTGITTDHEGHVIVADQCNGRLQVFTPDGMRVALISEPLNTPHSQSYPKGLAVTLDGHILCADSDHDRVVLL